MTKRVNQYKFDNYFRLSINKVNGKTPIKTKKVFTKQTLNEHRYKVSYLMKPRFSYNSICDNECEIKGGKK